MTGIYKITNLDNGKMYVGKAINIKYRWKQHIVQLNRGIHHNSYLQNSWNIHGQDKYEFSIIELCDKELLCEKEIFWINKLRTYIGFDDCNGYNLTIGGDGAAGRILTDASKELMYEKSKAEEIIQLSLDGDFINRWRSSAYASKILGIPVSGIRQCVLKDGNQFQCHGYIWVSARLYDNGLFDYDYYKEKYLSYYYRPINKYDLYGNLVDSWSSQYELSKINPKLSKSIKRLLNHSINQYNGYIYLYADESEILTDAYLLNCRVKSKRYKIKQFDLEYNYIQTLTQEEIEQLPYRTATIKKCCSNRYTNTNGGIKKAFGYIWEYD